MSRWLAMLLAVIGGGVAGFALGSAVTIALYAMLWMFVFGDDSWPAWVMPALNIGYPLLCLVLWGLFGWTIRNRLVTRPEAG